MEHVEPSSLSADSSQVSQQVVVLSISIVQKLKAPYMINFIVKYSTLYKVIGHVWAILISIILLQ